MVVILLKKKEETNLKYHNNVRVGNCQRIKKKLSFSWKFAVVSSLQLIIQRNLPHNQTRCPQENTNKEYHNLLIVGN